MSALLIIVLLIYIYALFSSVILVNSIAYALFSYSLLSLPLFFLYCTYHAYDVALTEVSIGVFLSFYFFYITQRYSSQQSLNNHLSPSIKVLLTTLLCSVLFGILLYICFLLEDVIVENIYSARYNAYTYTNSHISNIVTAILASYRAFDTFGETFIIAVASVGVLKITHSDTHSQKI